MTLTELADAVERQEPSRELDAEVFATVFPEKVPTPIVESGYGWRFTGRTWWCQLREDELIPHQDIIPPSYTTSLDAAMTLVPLNYGEVDFDLSREYGGWLCAVSSGDKAWSTTGSAKASTPAAALTAASLRAMEVE